MSSYPKIDQASYDKAKGQLTRQIASDVLSVFDMYGMGIYIAGAAEECVELAEQFAMRVRGKDIPIQLKGRRNSR